MQGRERSQSRRAPGDRRYSIRAKIIERSGFAIEDEEWDLVRQFRIYRQDAASRFHLNRAGVETGQVKTRHNLLDVLRFQPQTDHPFTRRLDTTTDQTNLGAAD